MPDPAAAPANAEASSAKPDLLGLPLPRLEALLAPWIDRPFRVRQVYEALHRRGVGDFADITNLSKQLRADLAEHFRIGLPQVETARTSADGTVKYLLRLHDGATIEAVDIPDGERRTFCISSQAGCALACKFCVTGYWGAGRDLTAGEIVGQVLVLRQGLELPKGLNLVFMGMGEPLLNPDNVRDAIHILAEEISWRRMTLSTVGILPALRQVAQWFKRPNLAISLHAPDDERRSKLMPINKTYPLVDLMAALREYPLEPGRKLTFEYILIRDFNDQLSDADTLASLLRGAQLGEGRAKVNLIPLNPDPVLGEGMAPPEPAVVEAFSQRLRRHGLIATVRRQRGDEVSGACGQLRAFGRDPRGFRTPTVL